MERFEQKLFGITIFTWDEWDEIEIGELQFYNVWFPFDSMKKYNGMNASLDMDGRLSIVEKDGDCIEVWNDYVYWIPEFMEKLNASLD